jgi:hypothetical protein
MHRTNKGQEQLNEVVVSDSKFTLSKEKNPGSYCEITANDLKQKSGQSQRITSTWQVLKSMAIKAMVRFRNLH